MVGRVLVSAVVSAILMMVWGFLYWGVFNIGEKAFKRMPLATETSAEIKKMLPSTGMYLYPFPAKISDQQGQMNFKVIHEKGPLMRVAYQAEGGPVMPPSTYVKAIGLNFVVALLAGILTAMASSSLPKFDSRFCFVMLLSVLATIWVNVGDVIWWFHSPAYCLVNVVYGLGAGLMMAVVIGSLVTRPAEPSEK